jgi:hypothetical protein
MMPKFTIFAPRRMSEVTFSGSTHEDLGRSDGVDVGVVAEGLDHGGVVGEGGHDAEFDLGVVAGQQREAVARDKGFADLAAGFRSDGMFCRLGSDEARRPVAATSWWKWVWMRPVSATMWPGSASR